MIGVYDYTVIATYLATVFGLWGMLQAIEGHPLAAIFCLLAAGLLDTVDGRIARTKKNRTSTEKGFGIQIGTTAMLVIKQSPVQSFHFFSSLWEYCFYPVNHRPKVVPQLHGICVMLML
jgi:hypothetical protein